MPTLLDVATELHEHEPDGTTTVSPFDAELMAVCTSLLEQDVALMVAAAADKLSSISMREVFMIR